MQARVISPPSSEFCSKLLIDLGSGEAQFDRPDMGVV